MKTPTVKAPATVGYGDSMRVLGRNEALKLILQKNGPRQPDAKQPTRAPEPNEATR